MRRFEKFIPPLLFITFLALTLPGISWGAPGFWHPDELAQVVDRAIERDLRFDEKNFDYPSLPKYVMYGVGKVVYGLGLQRTEFIVSTRLISVVLGGLVIALTYLMARWLGGSLAAGVLAALFLLTNRDFAIYSRFAHNDLYLTFFVCLSILSLIRYRITGHRLWLYGAFLGVGLATSSKYNGIGLLVGVLAVFLVSNWRVLRQQTFAFFEMLFVGGILTCAGYAIGTPRSVLAMSFYFSNAIPAILRQARYDRDPNTLTGIWGQWGVVGGAWGMFVAIVFLAALIGCCWKLYRYYSDRQRTDDLQMKSLLVLPVCILALDLPVMISYHYPPRFFLSMLPPLAVLAGLFVVEWLQRFNLSGRRLWSGISLAALAAILVYSLLRVVAVGLYFIHDNRIAAGEFLMNLPAGSTLEITDSPPNLPQGHFSKIYQHPIYLKKFASQPPPESNAAKFNQGEEGVEARQPDYLVVDSFTYVEFVRGEVCDEAPKECLFFQRLMEGETRYELIQRFEYSPPSFLPRTSATFVNPVVLVFQRK